MKRALCIAYPFPPCGGAGVQRTTKFVQYLPHFGWLPTVLTVLPSCYGIRDSSQINDLPEGVEVVRTAHFDPVERAYARSGTAGLVLKHDDLQGERRGAERSAPEARGMAQRVVHKTLRRALVWGWNVLDTWMLVPDRHILWLPRAIAAGLALLRRCRFHMIYATGEPYSSYFIALTLSRLTGIPFVVDMRDPWTLAPYRVENRPSARQALERWQERRVLARCRACIFANRAIDLYAEALPQWAQKFHYIPNGYDSADFEGVEPKKFDKFTIVHSGTFLPGYRTADTFLHALRGLLTAQPDLSARVQVLFVGKVGAECKLVEKLLLSDVVRHTGYVPHRESLGYLQGADLLLLVGGRHRWEETGKVYEYLAVGKPILALVHPDGAAAALLRAYPAARVVNRENVSETRLALADAVLNGHAARPVTHLAWAVQFERKQLTGKLAQVFNECV